MLSLRYRVSACALMTLALVVPPPAGSTDLLSRSASEELDEPKGEIIAFWRELREWTAPEVAVEELFLLFADGTATELEEAAEFDLAAVPKSVLDVVREAMGFLVGEDEGDVSWNLVRTFSNEEPTELFRAHIFPRRGDHLYFLFDGSADEAV